MSITNDLHIGLFISGGGTTMARVLDACLSGELRRVRPALVLSSRPTAPGIEKARERGMRTEDVVVRCRASYASQEEFGEAILRECLPRDVDAIWQCGWGAYTPDNVTHAYTDCIFNQHPGPLDAGHPDFGGPGMRGLAVHDAVLRFARAVPRFTHTEATVHRAIKEYDKGVAVGRTRLRIEADATSESLAQELLPLEHELVIRTIADFAALGSLPEIPRTERLIRPEEVLALEAAKAVARQAYPDG